MRAAYVDRRAMRAAELRGLTCDGLTQKMMQGSLRREWTRFAKLLALLFVICTMDESPARGWFEGGLLTHARLDILRAHMLALIALALLLNSILDHLLQRYALSFRLPEYSKTGHCPEEETKP